MKSNIGLGIVIFGGLLAVVGLFMTLEKIRGGMQLGGSLAVLGASISALGLNF